MTIYFHLPGLFEFYDFYSVFLPLFREHREYFYDWCEIGSIYGQTRGATIYVKCFIKKAKRRVA